jgi:hypothetical protein
MTRKRFNAEERGILSRGRGTAIEWQNVTQWHPGTLTDTTMRTDREGWQYAEAITHANAGIVGEGECIHVTPGHIRVPGANPR